MKKQIIFYLLFGSSMILTAQAPEETQKIAMEKLSWMEGSWQGIAWTQMGSQNRDTFLMEEIISYDLDRSILDIEGIGKDKSGEVAHHARAVISYNSSTKQYLWHAWRIPGGIYSEHEPELTERGFTWAMETPQGKIKYEVTYSDEDGWFEIGEFSRDGETWVKFFEMNLKRKNNQETKR